MPHQKAGEVSCACLSIRALFSAMSAAILQNLPVRIFGDCADLEGIIELAQQPFIQGITTNLTLMRKVGITDYEAFARSVLDHVTDKPVSFEVLSDEFPEMRRQALKIRDWQENVYIKIPITNTRGESALSLIAELAGEGVQVNVTAILTPEQVDSVAGALDGQVPSIVSVFAGRIADTGIDPIPIMRNSLQVISSLPSAERLWASVREVLNIFQAASCGCHIVTVSHDILARAIKLVGMNLGDLSLDTVQMFHRDAVAAKFRL